MQYGIFHYISTLLETLNYSLDHVYLDYFINNKSIRTRLSLEMKNFIVRKTELLFYWFYSIKKGIIFELDITLCLCFVC